jgi:hypothetical protein
MRDFTCESPISASHEMHIKALDYLQTFQMCVVWPYRISGEYKSKVKFRCCGRNLIVFNHEVDPSPRPVVQ